MSFSIPIAADHAGIELKSRIIEHFKNLEFEDLGPYDSKSVDYPDYADLVVKKIEANKKLKGILICGSGIGMSMRANKFKFIRAALVWTPELAKVTRQHNDANILCLPARFISLDIALECVENFFATEFEGGRHCTRVDKISL